MAPNLRIPTPAYVAFNFFGLAVASWGALEIFGRPLPPQLATAGHWQFLTNLSLVLTCVSVGVNIISTTLGSKFLRGVSTALTASALVAETLVAIIYWTLKLFFVSLIVPANVTPDRYIPLSIDLTIHLFPVLFLSIDYYLLRNTGFRIPLLGAVGLVLALTVSYWFVLEALVVPPAHYPYPFLNVDEGERIKIFGVVAMCGVVFYQVYEYLHTVVQRLLFAKEKTQ